MRLMGTLVALPADPVAAMYGATKQYVDAADGLAEKTANKSTPAGKVPNGYLGADASGNLPVTQMYSASTSGFGVIRLGGDLGGTATAPTVPALATKANTGYVDNLLARVSVRNYGALGDGTSDDTAAINAAIAACPAGGIVFFPPGNYAISAPLLVPPQTTFEGSHTDIIQYSGAAAIPTSIMALPSFAGNGMLKLQGRADQSPAGSVDHVGAVVRYLTIDGTSLPSGSATRGIRVEGNVREFFFEHVTVRKVNDTGFWFGSGPTSGLFPASFRMFHCLADTCGNNGYTFSNIPDSTLFDCNALGNANVGFYVAGFMNGQIANCRAEWSGLQGFYFTSGYWGTGQGSGGCNILNCSTDRSNQDGMRIDAQGSGALIFTNCFNRRDGRNNGTGGNAYAGFRVLTPSGGGLVMPVSIANHSVYPGVDDGGAGTLSPQYGISCQSATMLTVSTGYIHAANTALNDAGTNTSFLVDAAVGLATGSTTAPARVVPVGDVPLTQRGPIGGVQTVTYAATINLNAAAGLHFRCTLTGNVIVGIPANPTDGQRILIELIQDATGGRSITLTTSGTGCFNVTTGITGAITVTTTANTRTYIGAVYRAAGTKWDVLAFGTGVTV